MAGKNILLVDTDLPAAQSLQNAFAEKGFQMSFVANGKDAVQRVAHQRPDLILLEIAIPEMDGWDVCSLLKKNEGTKDIPIVFLSGQSSIQNRLQALQIGANGFIPKTHSTENLINQIEKLLARYETKE